MTTAQTGENSAREEAVIQKQDTRIRLIDLPLIVQTARLNNMSGGQEWEEKGNEQCLFVMPKGPDWNAILAKLS